MSPRRTNGKRQSSRFLPSAMKGISRIEMRGINALNLQPATPKGHPLQEMKRHRRTRMTPLARLELVLPPVDEDKRSRVNAEKVERLREEVPDVRSPEPSDSASEGSSVPALNFLQCARWDDSSEEERQGSAAPTCPSITFGSDCENESVGSSGGSSAPICISMGRTCLDLCHGCALEAAGISDDGSSVAANYLQRRRVAFNTSYPGIQGYHLLTWHPGLNEFGLTTCSACGPNGKLSTSG